MPSLQPLHNLPDLVLDPGPVGVNTSLGRYDRALMAPQLDIQGERDRGRGAAALGAGIAGAGGAMQALGMKQLEAIAIRQAFEADKVMAEAEGEIADKLANEQDETKWVGIAQEHVGVVKGKLAEMKISQAARDNVDSNFSRWSMHRVSGVKVDSARHSIARAKGEMMEQLEVFKQTGDEAGHEKVLGGLVALKYMSTPGAELQRLKFGKVQEQRAFDAEKTIALTAPEQWLEANQKPKDGQDADQYLALRRVAEGVSADHFRASNAELADYMVAHPLATPAEMQKEALARGLRPGEAVKWSTEAAKNLDAEEKARRADPQFIKQTFGQLLAASDEFSKGKFDKSDPAARDIYTQLHIAALQLPEGLRGEITGPLERKWRSGPPEIDTTVKGYLHQALGDMYENGAFGKTTELYTPQKGEEGYDGNPLKKLKRVNVAGQAAAQAARADATVALNEWMKQNPTATREQATKAIKLQVGGTMNGADSDAILKGADKATTPSPVPGAAGGVDWSKLGTSAQPTALKGAKVTSFGYAADAWKDSNSLKGIGAFGEQDLMTDGDVAVSPDVEAALTAANIRPKDKVRVKLSDGTVHEGRWMDRTANDEQAKKLGLPALRGRIDLFSPKGKHPKDGVTVLGIERA